MPDSITIPAADRIPHLGRGLVARAPSPARVDLRQPPAMSYECSPTNEQRNSQRRPSQSGGDRTALAKDVWPRLLTPLYGG